MGLEDFERTAQTFDRAVTACNEADLDRLAALPGLEYGKIRKEEAKRLGVPVALLDREVKEKQKVVGHGSGQGHAFHLIEFEPASIPVDGPQLLENLIRTITKYVVLPRHAPEAVALWTLRAHAHDLFDVNPRLGFVSPDKRCGKTTALELLANMTPRALMASNISPAAIFRIIEYAKPTLLMDELDSFGDAHEELRGILNSGHRRNGARVVRVVGDDHEPRQFSTWCPMALAAIGRLTGTLEDRSIVIPMQRRSPGEPVARLRWSGHGGEALRAQLLVLARGIARWVQDHADVLRHLDPVVPLELHDRAADNWHPLLAIAEAIGGTWPERARSAALALSGQETLDSQSAGAQLLNDISAIFNDSITNLGSQELCDRLVELEERPWSQWRRGRALSPAQLGRLLRPFSVSSRNLRRPDGRVVKGYDLRDLEDAFARYLPSLPESHLSNRYTATSRSSTGDEPLFQSATEGGGSVSENGPISAPDAESSAVADQNGVSVGEEIFFEEV